MKNYSAISQGIYKKQGSILVDQDFKSRLYIEAEKHPRNRSRILIHEDTESIPQEMVIAFTEESIVEVSTHLFPESFTMLQGVAKYIFYKENGDLLGDIILSPYSNFGTFYCFIPRNTFHRFIPYSKKSLAHEIGFSNFTSDSTKLYLEDQFKSISSRSNQDYSYNPRLIYDEKSNYKILEEEKLRRVVISGDIITISYDLIELYKDSEKPTLFDIDNQIPNLIQENLLCLLPGQNYKLESDKIVNTISILEGNVSLSLENSDNLLLDKDSAVLYTSEKFNNVTNIINKSEKLSILRFISKSK
tara:strand:+ start:383 stop:1291 length:909 start_codon:yes stop_codon:yes gene_type:complete